MTRRAYARVRPWLITACLLGAVVLAYLGWPS